MIIGSENTPYQNGLFFFELNFDKDKHPYVPPKATFYQGIRQIRFHPNFYSNGKVCLSLLNTWEGPKWSACQTLLSLVTVIASLFDDNPLVHEPGYENTLYSQDQQEYKQVITYMNIKNLIEITHYIHESKIFGFFENEIIKHLDEKKECIEDFIMKNLMNNSRFKSTPYDMSGVYDGDQLLRDFKRVLF